MNKEMDVKGKKYKAVRLLGKGKGGYFYLFTDGSQNYVLKQIHHEPCSYYQFENKLEAEMPDFCVSQVKAMCGLLYPANTNIDYFPTNFILQNGILYYIDYECNDYMEQWNIENWGFRYWSKTKEFLQYAEEHVQWKMEHTKCGKEFLC